MKSISPEQANSIPFKFSEDDLKTLKNGSNQIDSLNSIRTEKEKLRVDSIYNLGKAKDFSIDQTNMDEFINSPCYNKLGYDPDDRTLKQQYKDCEEQQKQELYTNAVIYGIGLLVIIPILYLFVKKKFF
jgi:hypothetical protein